VTVAQRVTRAMVLGYLCGVETSGSKLQDAEHIWGQQSVESITIEFRHLEHFLAVVDAKSFTKAAARVYVVQSTISASIKTLETDLGATLFDRDTHSVQLTEAGVALVPEARRVLADLERARDAVAAVQGVVRGTVRIGLMQALILDAAAPLFIEFHELHPEVVIEPRTDPGGSAALIEQVRDGSLDLALAWIPEESADGLTVVPLATNPMILIAPADGHNLPDGEIAPGDVAGETFVDFPVGWAARTLTDLAFERDGADRVVAVEVGDSGMAIELVRAGFGMAFIPSAHLAHAEELSIRSVRRMPPWGVALITPARRKPSAAAHAFIALISAEAHRFGSEGPDQD
jgi:DNA-binding transcriptional LysR family regulator